MDAVERALELLPWWVLWGPITTFFPLSCLLTFGLILLAGVVAGLKPPLPDEPWFERARRLHPTRYVTTLGVVVIPFAVGAFSVVFAGSFLPVFGLVGFGELVSAGCFVAALGARSIIIRRVWPERGSVWLQLRDFVAIVVLMVPFLVLVLIAGMLMPSNVGIIGVLILLITTLLIVSMAWGTHLRFGRLIGLIRPAPERVTLLVAPLAERLDIEVSAVDLIRWSMANAYAVPIGRRLGVTERALQVLADDELSAVFAHELGHIAEPRLVSWGRVGVMVAFVPFTLTVPFYTWWGPVSLVALVLTSFVILTIFSRLSRKMETAADEVAAEHEGDRGVYARALEKLYEANLVPAVRGGKMSSHPDLYDRMVTAGVPPSYERPAPPSKLRQRIALVVPLVVILVLLVPARLGFLFYDTFREPDRDASYVSMMLTGVDGRGFNDLGWAEWEAGEYDRAEVFLRAASRQIEDRSHYAADLARFLAARGRCQEAGHELTRAMELGRQGGEDNQNASSHVGVARRELSEDCGFVYSAD